MIPAPKVSVIVAVYNVERYIQQCIDSIVNQIYQNIEVICVDDGSTDSSGKILDQYAEADARILVLHIKNTGAAFARKVALSRVSGEYVIFVDSDDWIDSVTIAECLEIALQDDAGCVMFGYTREYPKKSISTPLFDHSFSYTVDTSEEKIHRRIVGLMGRELAEPQQVDRLSSTCMKLYRAEIAKKGRIISEQIVGTSEDTIFNLYALDECKVSYINKCFYHYRKFNARSITTQHKPDLAEKWDVMYGIMQEYIGGSGRADEYHTPFLNRVACGMIGLGLNEIGSTESIWKKSQRLRAILDKPLYREALKQLDTSHCGAKWKLFFLLCKKRWTFLLAVLLQIMNYLRSRMAA